MYQPSHGSADELRRRYSTDRLETASNVQIVGLCFDRIDRDLAQARTAIGAGDHYTTNSLLGHAQELVGELAMMLDPTLWEHAGSLLSVYDYVLRLLTVANTTKSDTQVAEAQRLLADIGGAFRSAIPQHGSAPTAPAFTSDSSAPESSPTIRISVQA